jgi:uncharacterized DUF497 family protein
MIDDEFEWDDAKAASNLEKHGVNFEDARSIFRDPFAVELLDDREDYGEERFILIGKSSTNILVVVHTERHERNRIISARKAEPNERVFYHEANQ